MFSRACSVSLGYVYCTDIETNRHTDKQTDKHAERQSGRQTAKHTDRDKQADRQRQAGRDRQGQAGRDKSRQRQTETRLADREAGHRRRKTRKVNKTKRTS